MNKKVLTLQDISYHGTGDIYASTFIGAYISNNDLLRRINNYETIF